MFNEIDKKMELVNKKRPLPIHTVNSIKEHLNLEWTYNSNAIEGNTLTLSETKVILEGVTIGGKTMREHLEVINHAEAINYVEEIVTNKDPLTEWQIKNIRRLILDKIDTQNAGIYRKVNVRITGATHFPPDFTTLSTEMENLINWYNNEAMTLHPVERASLLHIYFVKIHPFIDGNGRTSRLLLNFELMKNGYPPIVIHNEVRNEYYNALDKASTIHDYKDFYTIVIKELDSVLNVYFKLLNIC